MKTLLQFLFVLASAGMAWAQTQIVVPGGLENVEGNSSGTGPFVPAGATYQQVYSGSEFASLGAPAILVNGITFRLDSAAEPRLFGLWPSLTITMSTTTRSPDELSANMADNAGPSFAVFGGSVGYNVTYNPEMNPQPFEIRIRFTQPYLYEPSQGNLSMAMGGVGGQQIISLDAESTVGDGIGSVFANGSTLVGTPSTFGLITRFDITPIPEPSILTLLIMAAVVLFGMMRIRSITHSGR